MAVTGRRVAGSGRQRMRANPSIVSTASRTRLVLVAGTLALVLLHVWLTRDLAGPTIHPDENGYLGNARWLSGDDHGWPMPEWTPYYSAGISLLLAPLWWLFDEPAQLYQAVVVVNALLMASLLPLLYALVRHLLGAGHRPALIAAAVGALVPAALAGTAHAWAEPLALPLCIAAVLTCDLFLRPGIPWRRLAFGPAIGALYIAHQRFAVIVPIALVTMVVAALLRLVPPRLALGNAGIVVASVALAHAVKGAILEGRYAPDVRYAELTNPEGTPSDYWAILTDAGSLRQLAEAILGQAWYLAAGSLGLALLGLWLVGVRLRPRELRPVGRRTQLRTWTADPERLTLLFLLVSAAGLFALSCLFFTLNRQRPDQLIYGRHNESFMPIWVAAGVVFCFTGQRRARLALACAVAAVATGMLAVLLVGVSGSSAVRAIVVGCCSHNIPAVSRPLRTFDGHIVISATTVAVFAMLGLGAVAWLDYRLRTLVALGAVWFLLVGIAVVEGVTGFSETFFVRWRFPEQVERLNIERAGFDWRNLGQADLTYPHSLPDISFERYRGRPSRDQDFVFAGLDSPELLRAGARIALVDDSAHHTAAVWVMPGGAQDRLGAEGLLEPPGYPGIPVPVAARRAQLSVQAVPPGGRPLVSAGDELALNVRGRHSGRGSSWLGTPDYDFDGEIHVGARIVPVGPSSGSGNSNPVTFHGQLAHVVHPGERFSATIVVHAVDAMLRDLAPGDYEIEVGMVQEGHAGWFAPVPEHRRLALEVVP